MVSVSQILPFFEDFKKSVEQNDSKSANEKLKQLKKHFVNMSTFLAPKANPTEDETKEIILVRETLELAILLASQTKDLESFERHMKQVKTYYKYSGNDSTLVGTSTDKAYVQKSSREELIIGLNLLRLLSQNRIAEFHIELEMIPIENRSNMYIKHPIDLEMDLMEGSYNKVRGARDKVPAQQYLVFMDILMETVRKEFADCAEKAYQHLRVKDAQKLLLFNNEKDTRDFIAMRSWLVENDTIRFDKMTENAKNEALAEHKSKNDSLTRTLVYAKEMERIV